MYGIDIAHWLVSKIKRLVFPDEYPSERITRTHSLGYESEKKRNKYHLFICRPLFFLQNIASHITPQKSIKLTLSNEKMMKHVDNNIIF